MNTLTTDQAGALKAIRAPANKIGRQLEEFTTALATPICPHQAAGGEEHDPEHCVYCQVFAAGTSATDAVEDFTDAIDAALEGRAFEPMDEPDHTPALIAALEGILRSAGYESGQHEPTLTALNVGISYLDAARAAIAKAKGQTP